MRSAALLVVVAACWRGEPTAPVAPAPRAVADKPRWVQPSDFSDPRVLERTLRRDPRAVLQDPGPIVVADLDTAGFDILCDQAALAAQDGWSAQLADTGRAAASCRRDEQALWCTQDDARPALYLRFSAEPPFRLVNAVVGAPNARRAKVVQGMLGTNAATCP